MVVADDIGGFSMTARRTAQVVASNIRSGLITRWSRPDVVDVAATARKVRSLSEVDQGLWVSQRQRGGLDI
jgi:hypothetical protein